MIVIERSIAYKELNFEILEPMKRPKRVYYVDKFKETISRKIKRKETFNLIKPE